MAGLAGILWTVIVILFAIWIAGLILHFMGSFIWLLFVVAVVLLFVNLLTGRGATV
jgi:uncharacterized membrane protein YtjA (UPF0391 family)